MREKKQWSKRRFWLTSLGFAIAVHAIGLFLFQLGDVEEPAEGADFGFVSLPTGRQAEGDLLREQAELHDSAPLFFPTQWNASSSPVVAALEQRPPDLFAPFPSRLSYGETDFGLGAIAAVAPGSPLQTLAAFGDLSHVTFGEVAAPAPRLEERFALLEIIPSSGGDVVRHKVLAGNGAPAAGNQLWQPAEFLMHVTSVGTLGEPVLLEGTGVDAVDQFLRESLQRLARERMLDTGYYRVIAGP